MVEVNATPAADVSDTDRKAAATSNNGTTHPQTTLLDSGSKTADVPSSEKRRCGMAYGKGSIGWAMIISLSRLKVSHKFRKTFPGTVFLEMFVEVFFLF